MPTKTRINGENYTQLPRLVSDDIILKGLPNSAGIPTGYGDLANTVNALVNSAQSVKQSLSSVLRYGPIGVHVYGNSFIQALTLQSALSSQSNGRLVIVQSSGVGGDTSAQVLARLQADGINPLAKILLYIEGTNDAGTGASASTHAANMKAIADYAIERGVIPVICVTPPRDGGFASAANLNALQDQLIGLKYGIPTFDLFNRWVDGTDGTWTAGASLDGTHPTQVVYDLSGRDLWDTLNNGQPDYFIPRTNAGNGLLQSNVLQLTDTNADGLPDGWTANNFVGQTYPAMQDYAYPFRGKRARIAVSQTASGGTLFKQLNPPGKFSDNDEIYVCGVIGVDAISSAKISCFIRTTGVAGIPDFLLASFANTSADKYVSCRFKVPAGVTGLQLIIRFDAADGAGTHGGTVGYGCFDFYNVTTQALI